MTIQEVLDRLPPSSLSYDEWLEVGIALYHSGYDCSMWDEWSKNDSKYRQNDCYGRWDGFGDYAGNKKTEASIFHLAKEHGIDIREGTTPLKKSTLDWDSTFFVDKDFIEDKAVIEPTHWDEKKQIIEFLSTLFRPDEYVGFVLESFEKDGKFIPKSAGSYSRTCGEIIASLEKNDIEHALATYDTKAGGWVRFNPLDGEGCKAANVTEYRYCLVESDDMPIDKQYAMFTELKLPIATLVHSGGKSLHAIVKVNAPNRHEYQKRFEYIQKVCLNSGFTIDKATKDPSRLSRLPGLYRNGRKQYLIGTNLGCGSWDEWIDYIEQVNSDMPKAVSLADIVKTDIPKGEQLIEGILYRGHKMLVSGSSKAGKSSLLLELGLALASGGDWLGFKCKKCKVLYFNFEVQDDRFMQRVKNLYIYSGVQDCADNFMLVNLKGKAQPLKKLTNYILRLCEGKDYSAIILDPIYKIMSGNESDSEVVTEFTNQLDVISAKLNAAVIYCHHHSKGYQGEKNAMDRASGSGVFSRDADAIFDLIELDVSKNKREEFTEQFKRTWYQLIYQSMGGYEGGSAADIVRKKIMSMVQNRAAEKEEFLKAENEMLKSCENATGWKFETALRHFANQKPKCVWFCYPFHYLDEQGVLDDVKAKGSGKSEEDAEKEWEEKFARVRNNYTLFCQENGLPLGTYISKNEFASFIDLKERTFRDWISKMPDADTEKYGCFRIKQ